MSHNLKLMGGTDAQFLTHGDLTSVARNAQATGATPTTPLCCRGDGVQRVGHPFQYVAPPAGTPASANRHLHHLAGGDVSAS